MPRGMGGLLRSAHPTARMDGLTSSLARGVRAASSTIIGGAASMGRRLPGNRALSSRPPRERVFEVTPRGWANRRSAEGIYGKPENKA